MSDQEPLDVTGIREVRLLEDPEKKHLMEVLAASTQLPREVIKPRPAFVQLGSFKLNSGAESEFKLECDAFCEEDWRGFAYLISKMVEPFCVVHGVPTGGIRLAHPLEKYQQADTENKLPHLIVDDVLTTGGSMTRLREQLAQVLDIPLTRFIGAVLFSRGACPFWVRPLFPLPHCLWLKRCPKE